MIIRIDHYHHFVSVPDLDAKLTELKDLILEGSQTMAGELATLQQEVAEIKTVVDSAIALIVGLKAALDAAIAAGDPAALTALSAELDAKAAELAAAVAANTTPTP